MVDFQCTYSEKTIKNLCKEYSCWANIEDMRGNCIFFHLNRSNIYMGDLKLLDVSERDINDGRNLLQFYFKIKEYLEKETNHRSCRRCGVPLDANQCLMEDKCNERKKIFRKLNMIFPLENFDLDLTPREFFSYIFVSRDV